MALWFSSKKSPFNLVFLGDNGFCLSRRYRNLIVSSPDYLEKIFYAEDMKKIGVVGKQLI
jgi:hypothetical protein